jgi:hypothetical protein
MTERSKRRKAAAADNSRADQPQMNADTSRLEKHVLSLTTPLHFVLAAALPLMGLAYVLFAGEVITLHADGILHVRRSPV